MQDALSSLCETRDDAFAALLRAVNDVRDQLRDMNDRIRPITALIDALENKHVGIGVHSLFHENVEGLHDYVVICWNRGDEGPDRVRERLERAFAVAPSAAGLGLPPE